MDLKFMRSRRKEYFKDFSNQLRAVYECMNNKGIKVIKALLIKVVIKHFATMNKNKINK